MNQSLSFCCPLAKLPVKQTISRACLILSQVLEYDLVKPEAYKSPLLLFTYKGWPGPQ